MSAMEEIQSRSDKIITNIMDKEDELSKLQIKAEKAEKERKSLEDHSNKMLDEKGILENDIEFLLQEKETMHQSIAEQENEVVR